MLNVVYFFVLLAASPFLVYRSITQKKYRDGWGQKLFGLVPKLDSIENGRKRIWFHAVSVGEVNLLKPLVAEMDAAGLDWEFVVSSTSRTGFELAQKLFSSRAPVFYCPLDFSWSTRRAVKRIAPTALVLVELELWPNLIAAVKRSGAKVAIVNGRIGDSSFRSYYRVRRFLASTFGRIDRIIAQDERARDYFRRLSPLPDRVVVSGTIKFDGVKTDRANVATQEFAKLAGIRSDDVVFLCGSTQAPEEEGALETYRRLRRDFPQLKLFVAPRHKERFQEVAELFAKSGFPWTRRSTIAESLDPDSEASRVVLLDSLGELGAWWGCAKIAFVGGSWGDRGGQNMLEPAGYGAAVSFGPNTWNFKTIVAALLEEGAAVVVRDVDELEAFVRKCLVDDAFCDLIGKKAQALTLRNAGAAKRTIELLKDL